MNTIKDIKRLVIDVNKAIIFIRLVFKDVTLQDIPVHIVNKPNKGISNKDVSNIKDKKKNYFPSR